MEDPSIVPSARIYTPLTLKFYDWFVLGFSNRFAWRCDTRKTLLPFFRKNIGDNHVDIGVGTGYYWEKSPISASRRVTLVDLNRACLDKVAARVPDHRPLCVEQDVFEPLAFDEPAKFDSASMFYLLHCLPGDLSEKERVFVNLKRHLSAEAVVYGATILGRSADHTGFGNFLMKLYNKKGVFGNWNDSLPELRTVLERHFQAVTVWQEGKVALFEARSPKLS